MTHERVALGVDLHPAASGRPLFLAGVHFEGEAGLEGHSDGDVICHAIADALLGAATAGDLGEHFSDADASYAGISGPDLLRRAVDVVHENGFRPVRCDATLVAERPHIAPRREEMRMNLADALGVGVEEVSLKATRPEGLGLTGDGAGCIAVATVAPLQE